MVADLGWRRRVLGRLGGVRVRAALAATVVVAVILAVAAVAFVVLQRRQLESTLTDVAEQEAASVARQIADGGTAAVDVSRQGGGDRTLIQVVADDGTVVASSPSIEGEPPVVGVRPAPGQTSVVRTTTLPIGEEEAFVVVARGVRGPDGDAVVISAQSLESAQRATDVLIRLLAVGYPLLLLTVAATSYWLTGLSLAPVTAMRRRVADITASDLSTRVPVPGTGDEIAHLAATMNAMLGRLAATTDAQRRFVADASHELRSPLATIRVAHEIAAVHPEVADWTAVTADVLAEVHRLERLVDDLLFLARSDERGPRLAREDVDLDDLVHAEAHRLRRTTSLDVSAHAPPVRVVGDRHHLARALRNLADNAADHAAARVRLSVDRNEHHALVEVVDDGPGIPPAERERVFQRFVRLDASRQRGRGGTGLGLSIAQEIARSHGGDLTVENSSGGARLVLRLPLFPSSAVTPHPPSTGR
jgi:signal transduction histidine kinase